MTYRHDDGRLILAEWGAQLDAFPGCDAGGVVVDGGPRPVPMYGTKATGARGVSNGHLGVDLIRVPAGEGFSPHTHPGDHLLIAVAGHGTVTVDGVIYPTRAGQTYMVEGAVPHAVGAITDHVILAVGSPHRNIDAADRMTLTDYAAVAAAVGDLTCLVCDGHPHGSPAALRTAGCTHTPPEAPTVRPLIVGLAPATAGHEGKRAFEDTEAGDRLAALLDVAPGRMFDMVDTVNLSPIHQPRWEDVHSWGDFAGARVLPQVPGRVVVACGPRCADALGIHRFGPGIATAMTGGPTLDGVPGAWLAVTIPHPRNTSPGHWGDREIVARTRAALALAVNLARTGPAFGAWSPADSDAFNEAASRLAHDYLTDAPNVS